MSWEDIGWREWPSSVVGRSPGRREGRRDGGNIIRKVEAPWRWFKDQGISQRIIHNDWQSLECSEKSHKGSAVAISVTRSRVLDLGFSLSLFRGVYLLYHLVFLHWFIKVFSLLLVDVRHIAESCKFGVICCLFVFWFVFDIATVDLLGVYIFA